MKTHDVKAFSFCLENFAWKKKNTHNGRRTFYKIISLFFTSGSYIILSLVAYHVSQTNNRWIHFSIMVSCSTLSSFITECTLASLETHSSLPSMKNTWLELTRIALLWWNLPSNPFNKLNKNKEPTLRKIVLNFEEDYCRYYSLHFLLIHKWVSNKKVCFFILKATHKHLIFAFSYHPKG